MEWKPENYFAPAPLAELFPQAGPLVLDIGCGEGAFLTEMATRHPDHNFLATERMLERVRKVCKNTARFGLKNIRLLRLESAYSVKYLLPPESVRHAYVLFPDPWPKRAHHPRRLIQPEFLASVRTVLEPGGELRIKTDDLPYFLWIEKVAEAAPGFERVEWGELDLPVTNFERRFLAQGLPIHRLRLRKV